MHSARDSIRYRAPELERRLAAILAANVEGRLIHADEEATMATLSAPRSRGDELIAQHRGRIAHTAGDSVLAYQIEPAGHETPAHGSTGL